MFADFLCVCTSITPTTTSGSVVVVVLIAHSFVLLEYIQTRLEGEGQMKVELWIGRVRAVDRFRTSGSAAIIGLGFASSFNVLFHNLYASLFCG